MKISDVKIGDRARKDLGDISSLARSIERIGLLHPIVVTPDGTLIAGARRLSAFVSLGRGEIPHTTVNSLAEALPLLQAERDENIERKSFTPFEALAMAQMLEPFEQKEAEIRRSEGGRKGGRSKEAVEKFSTPSKRRASDKVASAVGISRPTLSKIKAVAQAANEDPRKFARIAKQMNETGNVDSAYQKVIRLKNGTNLEEGSKRDPERRWYESLHDLYKFMNSTRDAGGIKKLCAQWSADGRTKYAAELRRIISEIQKWIDLLEGMAA